MLKKEINFVSATLLLAAAVLFALAFKAEAAEGNQDLTGVELVTVAAAGRGREYVYSPVTGVVYIEHNLHNEYGIVEMSDPETGLPLTYERFCELAELVQE